MDFSSFGGWVKHTWAKEEGEGCSSMNKSTQNNGTRLGHWPLGMKHTWRVLGENSGDCGASKARRKSLDLLWALRSH